MTHEETVRAHLAAAAGSIRSALALGAFASAEHRMAAEHLAGDAVEDIVRLAVALGAHIEPPSKETGT